MTRPSAFRPFAAVTLTAALLAYVGCTNSTPTTAPKAVDKAEAPPRSEPTAVAKPAAGPFADWPESPLAVLVISGEQLGYLEPCGCTEGQLGGLLRRYEFIESLTSKKHWPLVKVDLGSLIKDPAAARGGPEQTKLKFHVALEALAALKYDALALSAEDLKVGVDEAVGQFLNLPGDRLKVVAANVTAAGLETKIVPSVRAKAGNVTVGITAVVDPDRLKALKDPSLDLITVRPIDEALASVLADLEKDTTLQVLLVQAAPEEAKTLAGKFPGFDVVVGTAPAADPPKDAEVLNAGKTLLLNVGHKGKYIGAVGLFDNPKTPMRYQRVMLGTAFDGPAKPLKAIVEDQYRQTLKDQGVVANFPRHDYVNGAPNATFLGAESCRSCHPNTFAKWSVTKHAQAYESLVKDPKPNTMYDAECVTCHTTGFEYNSGWKGPETTAFLKGNQCENCHGPGSRHVAEPDAANFRAALHLTAEAAEKNGLCMRCHDEDNSPHFDFAKYYGQIVHKGLDDYKDPKVHQGRAVKPGK